MDITVLMASGEADEWEGAADAIDDRGSLLVLYRAEDEISGDSKVMVISREIEQDPVEVDGRLQVPTPTIKSETFLVAAQYAPGMWIKVEYEQ